MCKNWFGANHTDTHHPKDCQCQYEVWAPGTHDKPWVNDAFNLYAMDVEEKRERATAIEKFISYLANTDDPNDSRNQWDAAEYSGICDFSPAEQEYVENEVARRYAELS